MVEAHLIYSVYPHNQKCINITGSCGQFTLVLFAHHLTSTPEPGVPYTVSVAAVNSGGQGEWTTAGGIFFTMDLSEFSWRIASLL